MLIINDLHIGANRMAGTTPASQQALRDYLREGLARLLTIDDETVIVNGDLFNGFTVDTAEVVKTYDIFATWLSISERHSLGLAQGNHDWNPRGDKLSSFHLLCYFLLARFPAQVVVFDKGLERILDDVWVIPHQANQDVFDLEIDKAVTHGAQGRYLLLHCNYKNRFAENSDHSLNLSDDQIGALMRAGWTLALGHEHVGYTLRGERVIVVGNQFPSSVSDCIGDKEKNVLLIRNGKHEFLETWRAERNYVEVNWTDLPIDTPAQFIRVIGDASAAQAADVVSAIAKFRQASDAFVVSNAVKVEGQELVSELALDSIEEIKKFDVLGCILEKLEPREAETVKELLG